MRPAVFLPAAAALLLLAPACLERVDAPLPVGGAGATVQHWEAAASFGGNAVLETDSPDPWERRYAPGGFADIGGLDANDKELWIADRGVSRLQAFDFEGRYQRSLGSGVIAKGTMATDSELYLDNRKNGNKPASWQFGPDGQRWTGDTKGLFLAADLACVPEGLWIADQAKTGLSEKAGRVPGPAFLSWDGRGRHVHSTLHGWPGWIAAGDGMVAVSEHLLNRVVLYESVPTRDGQQKTINQTNANLSKVFETLANAASQPRFAEILDRQTSASSQPGMLRYPGGVALAFGKLLVCDESNHRIQVLEARNLDPYFWGRLLKVIPSIGPDGQPRFDQPLDLDVADDGSIFLLDSGRNEVAVLSPAFERLAAFGAGDFGRPYSVACSPDGRHCFVSDKSGNKVWHYVRTD